MNMKAGIVGLGMMGMNHLKSYNKCGVEVTAVCDINHATLEEIKQDYPSIKIYSNYDDLFKAEKLDVLSVATLGPSHAEIVMSAAEYEVPRIICEKPLATSLVDGEKMITICKEKNIILAVNHCRRSSNTYEQLDKIIDETIGGVSHIHWSIGGGRLGCIGVHLFDAIRYLTKSEISEVIGYIDQNYKGDRKSKDLFDPGGYCLLSMMNGSRASIDLGEDIGIPGHATITGSYGTIHFIEKENIFNINSRNKEDKNKSLKEYYLDLHEVEFIPDDGPLNLITLTSRLIDNIVNNNSTKCTGEDGLAAIEATLACHISHRRGNIPIKLPLQGDDRKLEIRIS